MKVFKIYYETENSVETKKVLAKSRRSLKLPMDINNVIKIVDITEEFKIKVKSDINTINESLNEDIVEDIVRVLKAVDIINE